jgi:uncharacterized protein (TIGR03083 family)
MRTVARETLSQAVRFFLDTVERVRPEDLERPGLGVWSVRELISHATRGMLTIETGLQSPADSVTTEDPANYFLAALSASDAHERVAERGRQAAEAFGPDPRPIAAETAERVLAVLSTAADDRLITTYGGGMRLGDYLPTRVFELTVHGLDLNAALGLEVEPPPAALRMSLDIVAEVALRRGRAAAMLRAVTGRAGLPRGFSIF